MMSRSTPSFVCLTLLLLYFAAHLPPTLSCITGTRNQCLSAPFVPSHHLAGSGFNVLTSRRAGGRVIDTRAYLTPAGTCTLCPNPLQGNRLQKLPVSVVDWRAFERCSTFLSNRLYTSASLLAEHLALSDSRDWQVGLDLRRYARLDLGATRSSQYSFAAARSREDRYTFSTHWLTCIHYRYRVSDSAPLTSAFRRSLAALPSSYTFSTRNQYRRLIEIYGTHYIRQFFLGGRLRRVTATRTCLSSLNNLTPIQAHRCLTAGLNRALGKPVQDSALRGCTAVLQNRDIATSFRFGLHQQQTRVIGGRSWSGGLSLTGNNAQDFQNWLSTLRDVPDVVRFSVRPLYELVSDRSKRSGLKTAIEEYIASFGIIPPSTPLPCGLPNVNANCCPTRVWWGTLSVTIVRAWGLNGDRIGRTDAYVRMWYGSFNYRTRTIRNDNTPHWNDRVNIGEVFTYLSLEIEVWDKDLFRDDRLGSCTRRLQQGTNRITCSIQRGGIEIIYTMTCDWHLTGSRCNAYLPSPIR